VKEAGLVTGTEPSAGESATEPTRTFVADSGRADAGAAEPLMPAAHTPTEVESRHQLAEAESPHPPTEVDHSGEAPVTAPRLVPAEVVRYGPGVPDAPAADRGELTAERAWRGSAPARRSRRPRWLRPLVGWPVTAVLLMASGVVLYLRFHHAPFHVTSVTVSRGTQAGCGTDVTGRIVTNGAAGTVTYQWLVAPQTQPPRPLEQSVVSGQRDVTVTLDIQGAGQGSASQAVTLQVLSPDPASVSTTVVISC
jgi:hypothetical protein